MIELFVNTYRDPDPGRDAELKEVIRRNDEGIIGNRGIWKPFAGRPTVGQMLVRAGADINVLANADIYFDETLEAALAIGEGECYALTRWDDLPDGVRLFSDADGIPRTDSQDAWIWRGPVPQSLIDRCDFPLGVRGCDNRLTAEFSIAGYRVSNPSKSIRAIHLHRSGIRRYGHGPEDCVPRPYLLIEPHELGETPKQRWCF